MRAIELDNIHEESLLVAQVVVIIQSVVNFDLIPLAFVLFEVINMLGLSPLTPDEVTSLFLLIIVSKIRSKLFLGGPCPPDSSLNDLPD